MSSTVMIIVIDKQDDKEEQEKEVKKRLSGVCAEFQIRDIEESHGKSLISVVCKRLHPVCIA